MGLFGNAPTVQKVAAKSQKKDMTLDTTYFGKNLKIKGNVSGEGSLIIQGSFADYPGFF